MNRRNPWLVLSLAILVSLSGIPESDAAGEMELGKIEKAWQAYLELSASSESLDLFQKAASRRGSTPQENLGLAVILDSREQLGAAQTAYTRTLESVWNIIMNYKRKEAEALESSESSFAATPEEVLPTGGQEQALWLWVVGQCALRGAEKILPYAEQPAEFVQLLERIASEQGFPSWPGFQALQNEAGAALINIYLQRGQFDAATRQEEQLGFLKDFLWIGPFTNKEESGFGEVFPPEKEFDVQGEYSGSIGKVSWKPLQPQARWGYVDLSRRVEPADNAVVYAVTFVYSDVARPVSLELGHAGAIIEGGSGTAADKIKALNNAGVRVARHPEEIPALLRS